MGKKESDLQCPECGQQFGDPRPLGLHRRRTHGVAGKHAEKNAAYKARTLPAPVKTRRPRKAKAPVAVAPDGDGITAAFLMAAEEIERAESLLSACLAGLTRLTEGALKLRRAYIANADKIRKLQAQAASMAEPDAEQ